MAAIRAGKGVDAPLISAVFESEYYPSNDREVDLVFSVNGTLALSLHGDAIFSKSRVNYLRNVCGKGSDKE
jgi:hypothetical protein